MDIPAITPTNPTAPAGPTAAPAPGSNPPQEVERKLQGNPGGTAEAAPGPRITHTHAEMRFDEDLNRVVGRIVNEETGEAIQEFPPAELKALYSKMREQLGPLVDETA
jgi:hypothetical protein